MKLLAIIFSAYIVALNIIPTLELVKEENEQMICCSDSCHSNDISNQDNESNNDGCGDDCNPFMTCHTCVGCTLPLTNSFYKKENIVIEVYSHFKDSYSFNFTVPVWNPPKLG